MPRILLCDDAVDILRHVGDTLRRAGHAVVCTNDARDAECLLKQERYDLLVLDIVMPGMDGLTLLRKLGLAGPPALVMTGSGMRLDDDEFRGTNVRRVLAKPFTHGDVLRFANAILNNEPESAVLPHSETTP